MPQELRSVLYKVAFVEYNTQPDQVAILFSIHLPRCTAKRIYELAIINLCLVKYYTFLLYK